LYTLFITGAENIDSYAAEIRNDRHTRVKHQITYNNRLL
jgi:hypothetical protein